MWDELREFLLLERRDDGFCLVRQTGDGTRAELFLTLADLLCLKVMADDLLRAPGERPR
jgi:hypothetical protein